MPERVDAVQPSNEDEPIEPMSTWERAVALAVGVLAGGGGGWAVFVSENQAGTAVLLLMAAAFLLIGVQGTPLIKFDSTSGNLELERRMRKRAERGLLALGGIVCSVVHVGRSWGGYVV